MARGTLLGRVLLPESYRSLSRNGPVPGSLGSRQLCLCAWQTHHTGKRRHLTRPCLLGKHLQPQANRPLPRSRLVVCRLHWGSLKKQPVHLFSGKASPGRCPLAFITLEVGMSWVAASPSLRSMGDATSSHPLTTGTPCPWPCREH